MECYGTIYFQASRLKCFCDNLGVIVNGMALLAPIIHCPNDTTNDDHNIYKAISKMAIKCSPLQLQFLHMKGHQDDAQPNCPLTVIESLNVDCDKQAKQYTRESPYSSTVLGYPAIPIAQPHLHIENKIICRDTVTALWNATSIKPYCNYLLQWMDHDAKDIHWKIIKSSLSSFPSEDQQRLILFNNDKLPLWSSKLHPHNGFTLCPSYQQEPEDHWHFLECTQPECDALFKQLKLA